MVPIYNDKNITNPDAKITFTFPQCFTMTSIFCQGDLIFVKNEKNDNCATFTNY